MQARFDYFRLEPDYFDDKMMDKTLAGFCYWQKARF